MLKIGWQHLLLLMKWWVPDGWQKHLKHMLLLILAGARLHGKMDALSNPGSATSSCTSRPAPYLQVARDIPGRAGAGLGRSATCGRHTFDRLVVRSDASRRATCLTDDEDAHIAQGRRQSCVHNDIRAGGLASPPSRGRRPVRPWHLRPWHVFPLRKLRRWPIPTLKRQRRG